MGKRAPFADCQSAMPQAAACVTVAARMPHETGATGKTKPRTCSTFIRA